jgi:hypothetical protein
MRIALYFGWRWSKFAASHHSKWLKSSTDGRGGLMDMPFTIDKPSFAIS